MSFRVFTHRNFDQIPQLQRLPNEQRDAVILAFFRGLTSAQIATVEGIPVGTAKTRIRLGMAKLRTFLDAPIDRECSR